MSQIELANQVQVNNYKKKSQLKQIWKRMKKNRVSIAGLIVISLIILVVIFAQQLADYNTQAITQHVKERLQWPSARHIFGTDEYGRDVFARIVHGGRVSLAIGFSIVIVSVTIGGIIGSVSGYYGGLVDSIIMRFMDVIMAIPPILLVLAIVAALGAGFTNLLIAMAIAFVPPLTRIIRSVILPMVGQEFIEAAKACGTRDRRIVLRHILPNAIGPVIVQATMMMGECIISAAGLSFIGMGIQPPSPEWGSMLASAREYMVDSAYLIFFPGIAIVLTALSLNLMGDGLRDALDPRLKN